MSDINQSILLLDKAVQYCQNTTKILLSYLKKIEELKLIPKNRPLYNANLLDCLNPTEPKTSEMLKILFSYKQDGKYIIFRSFAQTFLEPIGFTPHDIHEERMEPITAETGRIDLWIQEKKNYAIIFESKLKGAHYKRNQLGRYIQKQIDFGYSENEIYIVLLPQHMIDDYTSSMPASVWKYPCDGIKSNSERKCAISGNDTLCWCDDKSPLDTNQQNHCNKCKDFYQKYNNRTVVLENDFADWLVSTLTIIDDREVVLKAAVSIFADYIKLLYGTRINNQLIMDITKYLKKELFDNQSATMENFDIVLTKIDETKALLNSLQKLKEEVAKDLIDEWYYELKEKWSGLMHEPHKSLGMKINGVWVGCWRGDDNDGKPYWGFYCENSNPTDEQVEMAEKILDSCKILDWKKEKNNWIAWYSTIHGSLRCDSFYNAAKRLNYLKD